MTDLDMKGLEAAYQAQGASCKTCEGGDACNGFECRLAFERGLRAYLAATPTGDDLAVIAQLDTVSKVVGSFLSWQEKERGPDLPDDTAFYSVPEWPTRGMWKAWQNTFREAAARILALTAERDDLAETAAKYRLACDDRSKWKDRATTAEARLKVMQEALERIAGYPSRGAGACPDIARKALEPSHE